MWLRKVEQLSQKEIAGKLGVQEKAVEKQVSRGMRLLTSALLAGADGVSPSDQAPQRDSEHG
jgi:DNA-directed RNA polymerase specialized sigma24 family protein